VPYCDDPDKFNVYPDVPAAIARLNTAGFLVIVITNQSGIGRGYFNVETLGRVHDKMLSQISAGGGRIDDIFFCPHKPGDHCGCRKPEIGMGLQAVEKYDIDVSQSYMIGDADKDIEFGKKLGCRRSIKVGKGLSFSDAVEMILDD
ncbi:MAG: HAD family hydrolase, partial [Candidatus Methanomethylophilaceae archaeon]|nr:HAD family hydrolase [Candidatus Methanomethylophilaceae archaeon]